MNDEDKTLLELAAKAAGFPDGWVVQGWNPLTDDGDALRLAVMLKIDIHQRVVDPRVAAIAAMHSPKIESVADEKQRLAATRRAIVRAAAEIGKVMK